MELLIVRHGEATPVGYDGIATDYDRTLTAAGVKKIERAADALNRLGVDVRAILSSPLPRAVQTSRILCDRLEHPPQLRAVDVLAPGADPADVVAELRRVEELKTVAICGHEPVLSSTISYLFGGNSDATLVFHTGSMAYMYLDFKSTPPQGLLHWFLDSRQLGWIAGAS